MVSQRENFLIALLVMISESIVCFLPILPLKALSVSPVKLPLLSTPQSNLKRFYPDGGFEVS